MTNDSLRFSIMAQELDRHVEQLRDLRVRVEQLEKAMHDLEGRYIITLPPREGAWTITPVPRFEEATCRK